MLSLKSLAAIRQHPIAGNFHNDVDLINAIYSFVENKSNTIEDRAEALRHLASNILGLEGHDAGVGVADQEFVTQYMRSL